MRRQQIGVDHRRAGALVLLDLGQHLARGGDGERREARAQRARSASLLVRRVGVAVDEADRDRPRRLAASSRSAAAHDRRVVERRDDRAVGARCARRPPAAAARHQRLRLVPRRSNMPGVRMRPISSTSRKPARGDAARCARPPSAGSCSTPTVVPCTTSTTSAGCHAGRAQQRGEARRPRRAGIGAAWTTPCRRAARRRACASTMSVKVPPMSTPTRGRAIGDSGA